MGDVVRFHARASEGARVANSAKTSSVNSGAVVAASRAKARQRPAGMPRSRQVLTVDLGNDSASATAMVPPSRSITVSAVISDMAPKIVREPRTCQAFANSETTLAVGCGQFGGMLTDPPEVIGARLEALRLACGCKTQQEFADEIGVEKNTYNPWEKGERPLSLNGALRIRKRFRIPLEYLFFGELEDQLPAKVAKNLEKAA